MRLTPEQEELLKRLLVDGGFSSTGEAIDAGLRLLEQDLAWKADARRKIEEGLDDLKNGRVVDGDKAMEEILAELSRKHRKGG